MITFNDFKKVELNVGEILEVNEIPNANKLYLLKVDTDSREKALEIYRDLKEFYDQNERPKIITNSKY